MGATLSLACRSRSRRMSCYKLGPVVAVLPRLPEDRRFRCRCPPNHRMAQPSPRYFHCLEVLFASVHRTGAKVGGPVLAVFPDPFFAEGSSVIHCAPNSGPGFLNDRSARMAVLTQRATMIAFPRPPADRSSGFKMCRDGHLLCIPWTNRSK